VGKPAHRRGSKSQFQPAGGLDPGRLIARYLLGESIDLIQRQERQIWRTNPGDGGDTLFSVLRTGRASCQEKEQGIRRSKASAPAKLEVGELPELNSVWLACTLFRVTGGDGGVPELTVTLIHGTFAKGALWTKEGSPLWRDLQNRFGCSALIDRFDWSGDNTVFGRLVDRI
jgi:hypothetical protein